MPLKSGSRVFWICPARKAGWLLPAVAIALSSVFAFATLPSIDHIELYPRDIAIHFYTDANRKYELQYTDRPADLTNHAANSSWTNLYVADSFPIPMHYVINDSRTNKNRFYRLKVTP